MGRGGFITGQRLTAVLLGVALWALTFLTSAWNLGLPAPDLRFAGSLADDPALVFSKLPGEIMPDRAGVSDAYRQEVIRAARRDPLNDAVFIVAALRSGSEARHSEALRRLELARKRDPRNAITRVMLLDGYLRQARAKELLTELAVLERLSPGSTPKLLPLIVGLAENASTREAAVQGLRGSPIAYPVMRALAERQVDPALIMSLRPVLTAEEVHSDSARQQISGLIDPYLLAGRWAEAAELWGHFYARSPGTLGRVTDEAFVGVPGPPFGWQFTRTDGGLVEHGGEGLQIAHFGRKGWIAARQALLLKPGTYRLGFTTSGESRDLPALAWRIDCAGSGATLLDLPFQRENFLGMVATDSFTVPAETCSAQWLALAARVGDTTEIRSVVIRSVKITRQGEP